MSGSLVSYFSVLSVLFINQVNCFSYGKILRPRSCSNGLLTGCEGHTEKYRTAVFVQPELARAVLKDQGPVFLSMARANPVNKPFIV